MPSGDKCRGSGVQSHHKDGSRRRESDFGRSLEEQTVRKLNKLSVWGGGVRSKARVREKIEKKVFIVPLKSQDVFVLLFFLPLSFPLSLLSSLFLVLHRGVRPAPSFVWVKDEEGILVNELGKQCKTKQRAEADEDGEY